MEEEKKNTGLERQRDILVSALEHALKNGGVLVNATPKPAPKILGKDYRIAPANTLMMAMHAENGAYNTNTYTLFNAAKQRGEAVKGHEKGVPFTWTNRNEYVNKENAEDKISRKEYMNLPEADKAKYEVNPREDTYVIFNVDQTTMPNVHKDDYNSLVEKYGAKDTELSAKEEKDQRAVINKSFAAISENLVAIKRDGTGVAHYDAQKDMVFMPAQKAFDSYADYVQETTRQVAQAAGIPQRLNRQGADYGGRPPSEDAREREMLVVELVAAHRMLELNMPAKLRPETVAHGENIIKQLNEKPELTEQIMKDVSRTIGMMKKAESGEQIVRHERPSEDRQEQWARQFPMDKVPERFEHIAMLKDDEGKWTLVAKPQNEPTFAIHPTKSDVGLYFDVIKNDRDEAHVETFRTQFAQKHYAELAKDPSQAVNIFRSNASEETLSRISNVNAFKTHDSKILLVASIDGEKQKAREISQNQWQRMFLADDKRDYKQHMAATIYADVLAKEKQVKEQQATEKKQEEQKKQEKQPTLAPILKQFYDLKKKHPDAILLFRTGNFYETYSKDAEKTSKITGTTLTKNMRLQDKDGNALAVTAFPKHSLDTYLPKLIRAGERVAICDTVEPPKQQQKEEQKVVEKVEPKQEETRQQEQHRGMHR